MIEQLFEIIRFVANAFAGIWPYLLITIPMAVAVRLSGMAKYIDRAFQARPVVAIFLATVVGAFSPFCSCSVIPVVASLLIGGVPLAPVMAFWIASPSMDPEIFFLSAGMLGWHLAISRLAATLVLSLSAGFITDIILRQGWLGKGILRNQGAVKVRSTGAIVHAAWQRLRQWINMPVFHFNRVNVVPAATNTCCGTAGLELASSLVVATQWQPATGHLPATSSPAGDCGDSCSLNTLSHHGVGEENDSQAKVVSFRQRLFKETWMATLMVVKFMALAFFLEALITLYVPSIWIAELLGRQNPWAIVTAALLGVPVYTSNLAALPLISGLLAQGMNPAAALAFLIAGPTTTLPAMVAVWGLVSRRVFALYVLLSLLGAVALGYVYSLVAGI